MAIRRAQPSLSARVPSAGTLSVSKACSPNARSSATTVSMAASVSRANGSGTAGWPPEVALAGGPFDGGGSDGGGAFLFQNMGPMVQDGRFLPNFRGNAACLPQCPLQFRQGGP